MSELSKEERQWINVMADRYSAVPVCRFKGCEDSSTGETLVGYPDAPHRPTATYLCEEHEALWDTVEDYDEHGILAKITWHEARWEDIDGGLWPDDCEYTWLQEHKGEEAAEAFARAQGWRDGDE